VDAPDSVELAGMIPSKLFLRNISKKNYDHRISLTYPLLAGSAKSKKSAPERLVNALRHEACGYSVPESTTVDERYTAYQSLSKA
jgi:hypothetical protein